MNIATADELLRLPADGWRYELVRGELRKMSPSGARHGRVAAEIEIREGPATEVRNDVYQPHDQSRHRTWRSTRCRDSA